jgi:nitrite reductase/ring-hydroxylating ferredoxin subunit
VSRGVDPTPVDRAAVDRTRRDRHEERRMGAPNWIYVLDDAALPEGGLAPVYPLGVSLVLARVEGMVYALAGKCAHMACPLFTGRLEKHALTCGCHDWQFDVRTGKFANAPELGVRVYEINYDAGKIFVDVQAGGLGKGSTP